MSSPDDSLPEGWEARKSRTTDIINKRVKCELNTREEGSLLRIGFPQIIGLTYYLNKHTRKSQWDKPDGPASLTDDDDDTSLLPDEVCCAHLLVKHAGSRRPYSWRDKYVSRTKEEALEILKGYREQILNRKATFGELARLYSDCSSASRDGDLGVFKKGQMQKPFEDVAFRLHIGQLSQLVETDSGCHIILRTA